MLIGFRCENFASFKEPCVFSMMSSSSDEYRGINTFETTHGDLLKSAFIYGANASGKTNLLKALEFMQRMVIGSVLYRNLASQNENFKFSSETIKQPTFFEAVFIIDGISYTYGFEILSGNINREWLRKKNQRTTELFERTGSDWTTVNLHSEMKKAEPLKRHTRPNSLFLTTAALFNDRIANIIQNWFQSMTFMTAESMYPFMTMAYVNEHPQGKKIVLEYLKLADIGIEDFEFETSQEQNSTTVDLIDAMDTYLDIDDKVRTVLEANLRKMSTTSVKSIHTIRNKEGEIVETIELPFNKYQSNGTKKFFEMIGPLLFRLGLGGVLVIDEIDSRLHCALVRQIISLFNSIDHNPKNAQLICNTHDTLLLDEPIRKDQVWFVEKNDNGESELYSLSDFKNIRKTDDILKKYLLGVFGAIPFANSRGLKWHTMKRTSTQESESDV